MGKRNKFSKIGMGRKNYEKILLKKNSKKLNTTKLNATVNEEVLSSYNDDSMNNDTILNTTQKLNTTKSNLNKSIINENLVDRQSAILGIDKETLMKACENPQRNRRMITKIVLSKGQRRRLEKKQKFKRRDDLVEKIKLNNSMINTTNLNKTLKMENDLNKTVNKNQNEDFNLFDIDNTLNNIISEEKVIHPIVSKNCRNKKNLKKILSLEKDKIKKVIENKNYQNNPLEAMKFHIKNAQLIDERNKKIEENFQKNYNFLNMKTIGK